MSQRVAPGAATWLYKTVRRMVIIRTVISAGRPQAMAKSHIRLVSPATVNRTYSEAPPQQQAAHPRVPHRCRGRAADQCRRKNRWGHRDATMVLVAYRHGLRASELVDLHWDQIEFASGTLHVRRVKQGTPSTHPIMGDELRALRQLKRERAAHVTVRIHVGARGALQHCRVCPHGRAGRGQSEACLQGTPAHAQARMRLRARRQRARYASIAGSVWPPQHPAHRPLH